MKRFFIVLACIAGFMNAKGQASFTGEYNQNFDAYISLGTLPTGWTAGGSGGFQGVGNGSGTAGGFYSFTPSCCPSDHSLGALHSGSATGYYIGTFINNTGSTITALSVSYTFEQYRSAGNTTGWDALFNGTYNAALSAAGVASGISAGTPSSVLRNATLTGLSIAVGATFTFRWTVNDLGGSDNGVAVDNFRMCVPGAAFSVTAANTSPVTEPAAVTLNGGATLGTSPYTYSWSGPSSYIGAGASAVISPTSVSSSGTYTLNVTDAIGCTASASTIVTVNPGSSCSGTPSGGTAAASPSSFCVSGSATIGITGGTAASGIVYQWQNSTTGAIGTFANISGATSVYYTTPTISATTYYRLITTCTSSALSDTSTIAAITINPLPVISAPGGTVCSGGSGLSITATGAATYTWSPATGLSATTGATVIANPTGSITYTVTGTSAAGCTATATAAVTYNLSPSALVIAPASLALCAGGAPQPLTATGGLIGPTTVNSGTITIPGSIAAFGTIASTQTVAGIPAGAVITAASVNVINFGSQYQDDYVINIKAPNNNVLNLINQRGSHTSTVTTLFANTNLSSSGSTSLASGSGTFTGTWLADAINGVSSAPYTSNVTAWSSLFSIPNGVWTLSIYNNTAFTNVVVPSAQWSLTLTYSYQAPVTWAPSTGLYSDAAGSVAYAGEALNIVYVNPLTAGVTTYTATATNGTCTRTATSAVTVNPLPAAITGTLAVCEGLTTTLASATTGGTWSSSTTVATIDAAGIVTGILPGTATITYTLSSGCLVTADITVNAVPASITGTLTVCEGSTATLSSATAGGTWSSSAIGIATVDAAGIVSGVSAGTGTITYTLPTGCISTAIVTVNPLPAAIMGTFAVCEGLTTTLNSATTGGTWSSGTTTTATIDAGGIVTGILAGTATITYALGTGCITTAIATVNPLPAAITGTLTVCEGLTTTLASATTGGAWSSAATGIATVDAAGVVTGVAAGTAGITYTLPTGCLTSAAVAVNPLPAAITGTLAICEGLTTALASSTAGGTWTSSAAAIATVDAVGTVTGVTAGNATITYTLGTGCLVVANVTVNPLPAAITGTFAVCEGLTTTLASATAGGAWSSAAITVATVDAAGVVSGLTAGTAGITYTLGTGCITSAAVTVNPVPAAITGILAVCEGLTATLASATTGGTWSSSATGVAAVDAAGVVSGIAAGTATITYALATGCIATATVTVDPVPAAITGTLTVCEGLTTALGSATAGGTWSSAAATVATIDAAGIVSGILSGTTTITYTLGTGCIATAIATVNAVPAAITGALSVCEGLTATLASATAGGTWSSSAAGVATVDAAGVVSGVAAGIATVTYTLGTGCIAVADVTVNPLPALITGTLTVCEGQITTLANATTGGTWSSSTAAVATVDAAGIVAGILAGTTTITYTLGSGCIAVAEATVNTSPAAITGSGAVCTGSTITLANTITGGTWTSSSANATAGLSTGVVTGVTPGTTTVTYTLGSGCFATTVVTVNASPATITGMATVCEGSTTTLNSTTTGGTWTSSNTNATIGASTGVVTGVTAGSSGISYTLGTGCATAVIVTVNALPAAITGAASVCVGRTTTLSSTAGGAWTSSNANATIGASSGIVTGVVAGTVTITYTLPTGCLVIGVVTVNPLPSAITGTAVVCVGATTTLASSGGGNWTSSNANTAIGFASGIAAGISAGTSIITYALPTGCFITRVVTVNPLPGIIGGTASVCIGLTTTLTNTGGGTWASSNANATIGATGIVTGVTAGTSTITYTLPTGCFTTRVVTIDPLPSAISGIAVVCAGSSVTLVNTGGGTWASGSANATVGVTTGIVNGISAGAATITYTLPTGCITTRVVTVNALPGLFTVIGGGTYCAGGTGVTVGLSGSAAGINYQLYLGSSTIGAAVPGTGTTLNFGVLTSADVYSVSATNATTGCTTGMTGVAIIAINPLLIPSVNITTPLGDTLCSGVFTAFTAVTVNGGASPVYEWRVNGSVVGTATGSYSYTPANGDVISVKLTSNATCATPDTAVDVDTIAVLLTTTPSVSVIATPGTHVCESNPVTFVAVPVNGGSAPWFRWTQNDTNVATGPTYTYIPVDGDEIYCEMFSNQRCRTNDSVVSSTLTLTVDAPGALPVVTIIASPGTVVLPGQPVTLTAIAAGAGASPSYQWLVNGAPIPGATNATYTASGIISNDTFACEVSANTLCEETGSAAVVIRINTGVISIDQRNAITAVPNPGNGTFVLSGEFPDGDALIEVCDVTGRTVYAKQITISGSQMNEHIAMSATVANGTYFVSVSTQSGRETVRIVIEK
ncbi:MAG: Ig-like domain-containing protein [Bacteroidota bacterium]